MGEEDSLGVSQTEVRPNPLKFKLPDGRQLNMTPALENDFSLRVDNFRKLAPDVKGADFQRALDEVDNAIAEAVDPKRKDELLGLREGLSSTQHIKNLMTAGIDTEPYFERLAKTSVNQLADAEHDINAGRVGLVGRSGPRGEDVGSLVLQVSKGAYSLAQARFPQDLKRQEDARAQSHRAELSSMRARVNSGTVR